MRTIMKLSGWIAWISAGIGFLFTLLGLIQILIGLIPGVNPRLFGDTEVINFFIASSDFFIITIVAILYRWQCKKE
jgi:hypothetical protein